MKDKKSKIISVDFDENKGLINNYLSSFFIKSEERQDLWLDRCKELITLFNISNEDAIEYYFGWCELVRLGLI